MPEINIRTDWIKEFSNKLFVTENSKIETAISDHPLVNEDYLRSAKHQLGITT